MKRTNQTPSSQERDEVERQVESLRREVRQLRLDQDLLNKANELLKKGLGVDLQLLSNREKTLLIDALREHYRLPELLVQLGLARSSCSTISPVSRWATNTSRFGNRSPRSSNRITAAMATAGCRHL